MQSNSYYPHKTDYSAIQDEYLCRTNSVTEKQYKRVATQVIQDIIGLAKSHNTDASSLESNLDIALELLLDLKRAINDSQPVWNKNEKIETLYNDFNGDNIIKPWAQDPERINIVGLNEVINKYLSYEWFSSSVFEHVLINAYLRYCIDLNRKKLIFSPPMSARSIAACCTSKIGYFKTYTFLKIIGIAIKWVMPGWLFIHALTNGWLITTIFSGIFIGYSIISTFAQKIIRMYNLKKLLPLIDLKTYVSGKTWSPISAMDKIKKLDKEFNMPELTPMLSKISKRNPDIFNVSCN